MEKIIKLMAVLVFAGMGVQVDATRLDDELESAARRDNYDQVEALIEGGAKPAIAEDALRYALENGNAKMAKLLVEHGANLKELNRVLYAGKSFLMKAADKGNASMVRFLIENGADLNAKEENFGSAALSFAAGRRGNEVVVRTFLTTIPKAEREKMLGQLKGIGPKVVAAELSMKQSGAVAQKDIRKMIGRMMMNIDSLVDEQVARVEKLVAVKDNEGETARDAAERFGSAEQIQLLDLNNPKTLGWLRHELEKNIRRILFSKPVVPVKAEEYTIEEEDPFGSFE